MVHQCGEQSFETMFCYVTAPCRVCTRRRGTGEGGGRFGNAREGAGTLRILVPPEHKPVLQSDACNDLMCT